ncbi:hypothetical protein K431DRAFT_305824 [Polychaeton citri CBS 116435]|uniref:Uncharacterized protein n=1 Tax=Polychaeton citri CBS 116435 TaxID=1314669 RepID=A0A9P4UMB4_9PEZI|nr:hypothetical protein K431DRAFT_305824 [Polychaeton citri CBS 116435]
MATALVDNAHMALLDLHDTAQAQQVNRRTTTWPMAVLAPHRSVIASLLEKLQPARSKQVATEEVMDSTFHSNDQDGPSIETMPDEDGKQQRRDDHRHAAPLIEPLQTRGLPEEEADGQGTLSPSEAHWARFMANFRPKFRESKSSDSTSKSFVNGNHQST